MFRISHISFFMENTVITDFQVIYCLTFVDCFPVLTEHLNDFRYFFQTKDSEDRERGQCKVADQRDIMHGDYLTRNGVFHGDGASDAA